MHSQTAALRILCTDKVETQQSVTMKVNEYKHMFIWSWTLDMLSLRANIVDEMWVLLWFQVLELGHCSYVNTVEIISKNFLLSAVGYLLP